MVIKYLEVEISGKIIYDGKTYLKEEKTNKIYSENGDEIGIYRRNKINNI